MLSEWLPTSAQLIQPTWGRSLQFFGLKHMLLVLCWVSNKAGCAAQGRWAGVEGTVTANFISPQINQNCYLLSNKPQHLTSGTRQRCCKQCRHERKPMASSAGPYHQNINSTQLLVLLKFDSQPFLLLRTTKQKMFKTHHLKENELINSFFGTALYFADLFA